MPKWLRELLVVAVFFGTLWLASTDDIYTLHLMTFLLSPAPAVFLALYFDFTSKPKSN